MDPEFKTPNYPSNQPSPDAGVQNTPSAPMELPKPGVIFRESWNLFKQNWKTYVAIMSLPAVFTAAIVVIDLLIGEPSSPAGASAAAESEFKILFMILVTLIAILL